MNCVSRSPWLVALVVSWAVACFGGAARAQIAQSAESAHMAETAQSAQSFTLEQILGYSFPTEMTAAPLGSRIAWVFNQKGVRNIWIAEGPRFQARQLTGYTVDDGQDISELEFSADGGMIVFTRGGNKNDDGEVPNPTSDPSGAEQSVWAVSWAGGPPRKIDLGRNPTVAPSRGGQIPRVAYVNENQIWIAPVAGPGKPLQIIARGRNGSPKWSLDGNKLAFASNRGSHSFIGVYDVTNKSVSFLGASVDRDTAPRWSPDRNSIAFVRTPARSSDAGAQVSSLTAPDQPRPWSIWIGDVASGDAREVWRSADTLEGSLPNMAGDALLNWAGNDRIIFASEHTGWMQLYSLPIAGGAPVALMRGECEFEHVTFTGDRDAIIFTSNCTGATASTPEDIDRRHLWRAAVDGSSLQLLTPGIGIEWSPVVTGDARTIAYMASDARQPAMPHVRPIAAVGEGTILAASALPKDFPADKLVAPQPAIVISEDGVKCNNQLFIPASCTASAKCPAVIFMHGGPVRQMLLGWHNRGYYHRAYAFNQYLASRGYVVLSVNYRSGIGYGRAFRMAEGRGARGATEYQDIVAAGRYLQTREEVQADRIGLWGGSYGGYLTAMGLARDSALFAAGVDLHGVHDWSQRQFGGALARERAELARASSPVASVDLWKSPVLLVHGDDDRNVDFAQTVDLAARLRKQGVYFEQLVFPDEVHDFLLFRSWLRIFEDAAAFLDNHLKSQACAAQ
ncbi:MAG: S9 family peptidase [Candidatus Acidiferrales bacterium]